MMQFVRILIAVYAIFEDWQEWMTRTEIAFESLKAQTSKKSKGWCFNFEGHYKTDAYSDFLFWHQHNNNLSMYRHKTGLKLLTKYWQCLYRQN